MLCCFYEFMREENAKQKLRKKYGTKYVKKYMDNMWKKHME